MDKGRDTEKVVQSKIIALGYYKKILEKKLIELEKYDGSDDKFHMNITHIDVNKMAENKLISYEIAHELNKYINLVKLD